MEIDTKLMERIRKWCATRERSQEEVKRKLLTLKVTGRLKDAVLAKLIADGFVNEARYAEAYVSGKFNIKGWGKRKIMMGLRQSGTAEGIAERALGKINSETYNQTLRATLEKYVARLKTGTSNERKAKTARYLMSKGYEPEKVWEEVSLRFSSNQ
jgi:regulatory protein